ncbi:MFS transporter [Novosphingobium indicum]|uniref:MFS transporter n=1 Tax=Novosphingobium indicum TaxID=462949 RepID=A0ABQ2JSB4_9SPHN|nr:MFS transporter [Novosphingobium indicum]GGN54466.1 MFS transporter [Novosphingobium indicum]
MPVPYKPRLSLLRIIEMNVGFFGLQFSFGLQQANMGPIYGFLGADEATMPLLWLAGPVTGLLVQPVVGAMSDRTLSRLGRRTPYFLIGAVICSLCLFAMPYSSTIWMAAGLLWLLDAGNNVTMEPYRAYVADRLSPEQHATGFLTQSAFTGFAQTLSYLAPSLLTVVIDRELLHTNGIPVIVRIAFVIGAILSISTILYSVLRVPELPLSEKQRTRIAASPLTPRETLREIGSAFMEMPRPMRQLAVAMLCQWYAMFVYWQYIAFALSRSLHGTADTSSPQFREAALSAQQLGAVYNAIAFVAALGLIPIVRRLGARRVHAVCLAASGAAMLTIPATGSFTLLMFVMVGIGLGWAGMMGNTYVMLADSIPPARTGVYMGVFNIFIVVPMLVETVTMPLIYRPLLGGDPRNALILAGVLMLLGAVATLLVAAGDPPERSGS